MAHGTYELNGNIIFEILHKHDVSAYYYYERNLKPINKKNLW